MEHQSQLTSNTILTNEGRSRILPAELSLVISNSFTCPKLDRLISK